MQQPRLAGLFSAVKSCTNALSLFFPQDAENFRLARTDGRTNTPVASAVGAATQVTSMPSTFVMVHRQRGVAVAVMARMGT